jgi:predicted CXXCH cytochrome family protein
MKFIVMAYIIFFLLLSVNASAKIEYTKEQVHGVNQDCTICHLSHKMKEVGLLKKPFDVLCLECHPERKAETEHAVDIVPEMDVGGLLLTDGKMTCVTCHDSHKNTYRNMLRVPPEDLCQKCHRY